MPRRAIALLVPLLAGCIVPLEPMRLAAEGPRIELSRPGAPRPRPGERVALLFPATGTDAEGLRRCVLAALDARLPQGQPRPAPLDETEAARLGALLPPPDSAATLPAGALPGFDWLVAMADLTTAEERDLREAFGGTPGSLFPGRGLILGTGTRHHLALRARLFDLRSGAAVAMLDVWHDTEGSQRLVLGVIAGDRAALPFAVPVAVLPAGTDARAICRTFGAALAGLVAAAEPGSP